MYMIVRTRMLGNRSVLLNSHGCVHPVNVCVSMHVVPLHTVSANNVGAGDS
jgi:hypothetical protein